MYLAEIHGKFRPHEERMEDILTSDVFSFFKYARRDIFLHELLSLLNLDVTPPELMDAEFIFWPSYEDGTEPDLVIIVGNYYLLFEAKFHSGFGKGHDVTKHQLPREIKDGKLEAHSLKKEFLLVAITAHYSKHRFLLENSEYLHHAIQWLNWHHIALLLYEVLEENELLDIETRSFAEDLYSLLVKKNLRKFAGTEILSTHPALDACPTLLFFDPTTAQYRGAFWGFQNTLGGTPQIHILSNILFFKRFQNRFSINIQDILANTPDVIYFKR